MRRSSDYRAVRLRLSVYHWALLHELYQSTFTLQSHDCGCAAGRGTAQAPCVARPPRRRIRPFSSLSWSLHHHLSHPVIGSRKVTCFTCTFIRKWNCIMASQTSSLVRIVGQKRFLSDVQFQTLLSTYINCWTLSKNDTIPCNILISISLVTTLDLLTHMTFCRTMRRDISVTQYRDGSHLPFLLSCRKNEIAPSNYPCCR